MERKIHFRENRLIFLGIWREAELISKDLGSKGKCFQGAEELSVRDLGRSMHYFQGSRKHRPPPLGSLNSYRKRTFQDFSNINEYGIKFGLAIKKVKVNSDSPFVKIWKGPHSQCYILSPKAISLLVPEKKIFLPYMDMAAIRVM